MNLDRTEIRALLLAGLDTQASIEHQPIDEVRLALDQLGIDPKGAIRFAKRLAEATSTDPADQANLADHVDPAVDLLRKIEQADALDAEIADFENMPLDDVLAALPEDQRRPPNFGNDAEPGREQVVAKPKRRLVRVLGWGGSIAGIAASVLLFVAVRPDLLGWTEGVMSPGEVTSLERQAEALSPEVAPDVAARSDIVPDVGDGVARDAGSSAAGVETAIRSRRASTASELRREPDELTSAVDRPAVAAATANALSAEVEDATQPSDADDQTQPPRPRLRPGDLETTAAGDKAETPLAQAEQQRLEESEAEVETSSLASVQAVADQASQENTAAFDERNASFPLKAESITGVFVVDAERVPSMLRSLEAAQSESDGRLAARLGEASLRALGQKVLALVSFERDGQEIDAAVVEVESAEAPASDPALGVTSFAETDTGAGNDQVSGSSANAPKPGGSAFDILELPTKE